MAPALRVLIVEDDRPMAQMCAKLIQRHGHFASIAGSCEDALAIVKAEQAVDVVITDIQMPRMTGMELLAQLRIHKPQLPVILMTGYANVLGSTQALALGAVDYLTKPFDSERLIGSLQRVFHPEHV